MSGFECQGVYKPIKKLNAKMSWFWLGPFIDTYVPRLNGKVCSKLRTCESDILNCISVAVNPFTFKPPISQFDCQPSSLHNNTPLELIWAPGSSLQNFGSLCVFPHDATGMENTGGLENRCSRSPLKQINSPLLVRCTWTHIAKSKGVNGAD